MVIAIHRSGKSFSSSKGWKFYDLSSSLTGSQNAPGAFLFQAYNHVKGQRSCPGVLEDLLDPNRPVAFTTFEGRNQKAGTITSYLLRADRNTLEKRARQNSTTVNIFRADDGAQVDLQYTDASQLSLAFLADAPVISEPRTPPKGADCDLAYNIYSEHLDLGLLTDSFIAATRDDITRYCQGFTAKRPKEKIGFRLVERVRTDYVFDIIKPSLGQLVKFGKGVNTKECLIDIGIDLSKGCIANITPEGSYNPEGICSYCYGFNNRCDTARTMFDFTPEELRKLIGNKEEELSIARDQTLYIRLGQTTEVNMPGALREMSGAPDQLKKALKILAGLAQERKIKVIMPTKVPDFDKTTIELLKNSKTTVLVSIAYQQLERGIVAHGYNIERRLELGLRAAESGVNTALYCATDITRSRGSMQDDVKRAVEFWNLHRALLGLQFLDMRITRDKDAQIIGGASWSQLKYDQNRNFLKNKEDEGRWALTRQNYLHALHTHPDFLTIAYNHHYDMRLCSTHVVPDERACGMCFTDRIKSK